MKILVTGSAGFISGYLVEELLEQGMDKKEAFKTKAREYGIKKSMLYNYFVKSK